MRTLIRGTMLVLLGLAAWILVEAWIWGGGPGTRAILAVLLLLLLFAAASLSLRGLDGPHRERVTNVWLALAASVVVIVAFDLAAGWLLVSRLSPASIPDPVVHHRLEPGAASEFRTREFEYVQHVNTLGLRGPEITPEVPDGSYRILLLGDSFAMGKGVADDRTFAARLGGLLRGAGGEAVEVANAGVDSYAPILSYLQYREQLAGLEADLVILALDMSDLVQEQAYRAVARFGPAGDPVAVPAPDEDRRKPSLRFRDWLYEHTYLTRLALYRLERAGSDPGTLTVEGVVNLANPELLAHTLATDTVPRGPQWDDLFDSIVRIRELATRRGADFLLLVYPWGHQVGEAEWMPGRRNFVPDDAEVSDASLGEIRRRAEAAAIPVIDVVEGFRDREGTEPLYFSTDMHFTESGHTVMAELLAGALAGRDDLTPAR